MSKLQGKTAVITGGSSGIGLATASLFAREGADVIIAARSEEGLATAREAIGARCQSVQADVTRPADLARLYERVRARHGGIDVLVINAAIVKLAPIADTSEALFGALMDTNVKGAFDTLRLAIPTLRDGASVVITTSWLGRVGFAGSSVTAMSKAALRALTRVAATELAPRGIRVNALAPGAIETPLWGKLGLPSEALDAAGAAITLNIPLHRWGKADEVARAALFLAGGDSTYITGIELRVDGGMDPT